MKDCLALDEMDIMRENDCYEDLLKCIRESFKEQINGNEPLFTTEIFGLWDLFMENLPDEARQHYNCNACRSFINRYGGLVRIDSETGRTQPVMWGGKAPAFFQDAVGEMAARVRQSTVNGVFLTAEKNLGTPVTGCFEHMSVKVPASMLYRDRIMTVGQKMAEKREDFKMLKNAVHDFSMETVQTAVGLLQSESLYRGEKVLGVAEWFLKVIEQQKKACVPRYAYNLLWKTVATAPEGFCHIRSSMIGTLLEDIEDGLPYDTVKRKFGEKMNPLQYQRPQVAPAAGNVARAEQIVAKLGIERSLERRYARLEELETIWNPKGVKRNSVTPTSGVFAGVEVKSKKKNTPKMDVGDTRNMTFEKFRKTILPMARKIEYRVFNAFANFGAISTAVHDDAPPILQWDREDRRNPFAWYVYAGGSGPQRWGLNPGWVDVTGIALQPSMWDGDDKYQNHGKSVFFILDGARDTNGANACLFPETLKSELREVRATIEQFSRQNTMQGKHEASACGIRLVAANKFSECFRVTTDTAVMVIVIDRWD